MESLIAAVVSAVIAVIAALVFLSRTKGKAEKNPVLSAPKDGTADIARGTIRQTFEEEVGKTSDALDGDSPASDLADLGNARRRR